MLAPRVESRSATTDTPRVDPTPEQMERAVTALVPYVQEWKLPLNPEHLYELAGAVLKHFDSRASDDAIYADEQARIAEIGRQQAQLYRDK
jgi:hypothetical protein